MGEQAGGRRQVAVSLYEQLVETGPDGLVYVDSRGVILLVNRQAEALFGYQREALVGQHFCVLVPEASRDRHAAHFAGYLADPGNRLMGTGLALRGRRSDGGEFPVDVSLSSTRVGGELFVTAAVRDISERAFAEASQGRLAAIIESSEDAVLSKNLDGVITSWNKGAEAIYGYSAAEMIGRPVGLLVPPGHDDWKDIVARVGRGEQVAHYETVRMRADGSLIDVSLSVSPVRGPAGGIVGAATISRDITAHKQAERALRQAEERWERAFDGAPFGMAEVGPDGRYVRVNPAFCHLTGYSAGELAAMTFADLVAPAGREWAAAARAAFVEGEVTELATEARVRHADGHELWLEAKAVTLPGPDNQLLVTYQDVSAHKAEQAELADLRRRNREAKALEELRDLLAGCLRAEEAYDVLSASGERLFPRHAGVASVIHPSRDLVDAVATWGDTAGAAQAFGPEQCWALRLGRPHMSSLGALRCSHVEADRAAGWFCVPMVAMGETVGVLQLRGSPAASPGAEGAEIGDAARELAVMVANQLALAAANLGMQEKLRDLSIRDPLTNLFNRRYMEETLRREVARATRDNTQVSVLQIDVDHFKAYNDTHGHDTGDAVLKAMAGLFASYFRGSDVACRYGGEEFNIVLPGANLASSEVRARTLQELVARTPVPHNDALLEVPTLSIGVAAFPDHGATPEEVLKAADLALYRAKTLGRNRVVVAPVDLRLDAAPAPTTKV